MSVNPAHYEELLANYSNQVEAIALLKQYRPYLEMLPSMRRAQDSLITLPLPLVRVRHASSEGKQPTTPLGELTQLPCEVALLMCDPDWKVKTGIEIFVFIHRPQEDFSDFLGRWRQTQVWLDRGYEWEMPLCYRHITSEEAEDARPLFVVFPDTPERIKRGLRGAYLPFVVEILHSPLEDTLAEKASPQNNQASSVEELSTDS